MSSPNSRSRGRDARLSSESHAGDNILRDTRGMQGDRVSVIPRLETCLLVVGYDKISQHLVKSQAEERSSSLIAGAECCQVIRVIVPDNPAWRYPQEETR